MFLLKTVTRPGFFQSARLFVFTLLDLTDIWNYIWVRKNAQFLLLVNNCLSRKSRRFFRHTFRSLLNITKVTEYCKVCWILQSLLNITKVNRNPAFPLLLSCSVVFDSVCPHGHARLLCPPLSPRIFSNSCPLSQWCYLTISPSAALFSFCCQSSPASAFPISWLFVSGGQSVGTSTSSLVLPVNIQDCFPLGLTGLIYPLSTLKVILRNSIVFLKGI